MEIKLSFRHTYITTEYGQDLFQEFYSTSNKECEWYTTNYKSWYIWFFMYFSNTGVLYRILKIKEHLSKYVFHPLESMAEVK